MAAMGCSALRPVEVRIRPERARGRVAEPFLCSSARRPVGCRSSRSGMEAPPRPRRSPRRSGAGRSRPPATLPAAGPCAHAVADLTCPALGLSRAWPGRVADGSGHRAVAGSALAPPAFASRDCPWTGYRHRVPSGLGRADRRFLALRRRHRAPGGIPLHCGLRRCAGFLLRARPRDLYRPHEPARGPVLYRCCCEPHGAGTRHNPCGLVFVGGVRSGAGPVLAGRGVVNVNRVHGRAHTQGERHRQRFRSQTPGNTGGRRSPPMRQPLRSWNAPAVLRPRPRRDVPCRALRGSEPGGHHSRAGSPAGSGIPLRLRRYLSKLLVRHVGDDGCGRLVVPAEWPGGRVGVPPRCRRRHARPGTRAVPAGRSHGSVTSARRRGSLIHRRRSPWHRVSRNLVVAARVLAGGRIAGAVCAGGFRHRYGISARRAIDDADARTDRLLLPRGARRARERCPSLA